LAKKDMSGQDTNRTNDSYQLKDFIIPELEEAPDSRRPWSKEEIDVLVAYYGKKDPRAIKKYLDKTFPPGRSLASIYKKGQLMNLGRHHDS